MVHLHRGRPAHPAPPPAGRPGGACCLLVSTCLGSLACDIAAGRKMAAARLPHDRLAAVGGHHRRVDRDPARIVAGVATEPHITVTRAAGRRLPLPSSRRRVIIAEKTSMAALIKYLQRPHHFIVLMVQNVAVPDVPSRNAKANLDAGDMTWQCDHGVLISAFPRLWG